MSNRMAQTDSPCSVTSRMGCPGRKIRRSQAHRLIVAIYPAIGVMRCPARGVLEQANRTNPPIRTQIKPVPRAARNADQVATFHFDRSERADAWPDVKKSATMNDEAHFVFVVPVFATELGQHGFQVRGLRCDINHIRRDITAVPLKLFDFGAVRRENLFRCCIVLDSMCRFPAFVLDSDVREVRGDAFLVVQSPVLVWYSDNRHMCSPLRTQTAHSIVNCCESCVVTSPSDPLQQELQDLDMAFCLSEIVSPSVEPVAS